jgi:FtsZ-interacting cell division protein YlmF
MTVSYPDTPPLAAPDAALMAIRHQSTSGFQVEAIHKRQLALAVLTARERIRSTVSRILHRDRSDPSVPPDEILARLKALRPALVAVQDLARVSIHDIPTNPRIPNVARITTLHPRTYNEARTIGEHFREGAPLIVNMTEMNDSDAKRLVDFAAGLIFGLRGSIERVTGKVFLLTPAAAELTTERETKATDYPQAALAVAAAALETVEDLTAIITEVNPPMAQGNSLQRLVAGQLQQIQLPLNLSGIDLTNVTLHVEDLTGAIWNDDTQWPNTEVATTVRSISEELTPGTWRIRTGTERDPSEVLLPV